MTPDIHFRVNGDGPRTVIVLHGLLGSGANWHAVAMALADRGWRVLRPDARNHGRSFHDSEHDYNRLADDVSRFMDEQSIGRAHLLGHSMGGVAAMLVAARQPGRVQSLVVADIAPRAYHSYASEILAELDAADFAGKSRADIYAHLFGQFRDRPLVRFVMTNLAAAAAGGYRWRINVPSLLEFTRRMEGYVAPPELRYAGPALFLLGGASDYVAKDDHALIHERFPAATIEAVPDAGHWLHVDKPEEFMAALDRFYAASPG